MQFLVENGNIDLEDIQKQLKMKEREKILSNHHYKIWEGVDGYWRTYLPDDNGKLKMKKRKDYQSIEDDVYQYYYDKIKRPKFREVFEEWIAEKEEYEEIQKNSITRYRNSFNRFFPENEEFCSIKLVDITDSDLEKFLKKSIKNHKLTRKTYSSLTLILQGVFRFARRENYTDFSIANFMNNFEPPKKIFKKKPKDPKLQVFSRKEAKMLIEYFLVHIDIINLGLALMFYTGLRVGELSTLKKEDNAKRYFLNICRTEVTYQENGKYVNSVKELPKGDDPRIIDIPQKGQKILDQIILMSPNKEYLFSDDYGRIRSARFNYRLKKVCEELQIPVRSTHKIRKTYGSNLLENNVGEALTQSQLGHKQISTTHNYYHYDITDDEERSRAINEAVSYY